MGEGRKRRRSGGGEEEREEEVEERKRRGEREGSGGRDRGGEAENVELTRYMQKIHCTHLNLSRAVLHMRSLHSTTAASHFCLCSLSRMKSAEVK